MISSIRASALRGISRPFGPANLIPLNSRGVVRRGDHQTTGGTGGAYVELEAGGRHRTQIHNIDSQHLESATQNVRHTRARGSKIPGDEHRIGCSQPRGIRHPDVGEELGSVERADDPRIPSVPKSRGASAPGRLGGVSRTMESIEPPTAFLTITRHFHLPREGEIIPPGPSWLRRRGCGAPSGGHRGRLSENPQGDSGPPQRKRL